MKVWEAHFTVILLRDSPIKSMKMGFAKDFFKIYISNKISF